MNARAILSNMIRPSQVRKTSPFARSMRPVAASLVLAATALGCGGRSELPIYDRKTEDITDAGKNDTEADADASNVCEGPDAVYLKIGSDIRVSDSSCDLNSLSIAWTGNEYMAAWSDGKDIYIQRLSIEGSPIEPEKHVSEADDSSSDSPSIACRENGCGIAWVDRRDGNPEIYFKPIKEGMPVGLDIRVTNDADDSLNPSLAPTENGYAVSWQQFSPTYFQIIYLRRLSENGVSAGPDIFVSGAIGYDAKNPSLVCGKNGCAVSWDSMFGGISEISFQRLTENDIPIGQNTFVSDADGKQSFLPSLACIDTECAVSWSGSQTDGSNIHFKLIKDGSPVGQDTPISNNAGNFNPSLVPFAGGYAVTWGESAGDQPGNIYFKLLINGSPIGQDNIISNPVLSNKWIPSLAAATGKNELGVVWADNRDADGGSDSKVYFARVGCVQ